MTSVLIFFQLQHVSMLVDDIKEQRQQIEALTPEKGLSRSRTYLRCRSPTSRQQVCRVPHLSTSYLDPSVFILIEHELDSHDFVILRRRCMPGYSSPPLWRSSVQSFWFVSSRVDCLQTWLFIQMFVWIIYIIYCCGFMHALSHAYLVLFIS